MPFCLMWSHLGLNQGLPDYESGALTNWAMGPILGNDVQKSWAKVRVLIETRKSVFHFPTTIDDN